MVSSHKMSGWIGGHLILGCFFGFQLSCCKNRVKETSQIAGVTGDSTTLSLNTGKPASDGVQKIAPHIAGFSLGAWSAFPDLQKSLTMPNGAEGALKLKVENLPCPMKEHDSIKRINIDFVTSSGERFLLATFGFFACDGHQGGEAGEIPVVAFNYDISPALSAIRTAVKPENLGNELQLAVEMLGAGGEVSVEDIEAYSEALKMVQPEFTFTR